MSSDTHKTSVLSRSLARHPRVAIAPLIAVPVLVGSFLVLSGFARLDGTDAAAELRSLPAVLQGVEEARASGNVDLLEAATAEARELLVGLEDPLAEALGAEAASREIVALLAEVARLERSTPGDGPSAALNPALLAALRLRRSLDSQLDGAPASMADARLAASLTQLEQSLFELEDALGAGSSSDELGAIVGEASTKLVALEQIVSERSAASSFAAELGTIARALDGVGAAAAAADAVEIAGAELAPSEAPGAVDARVDVLVDRVLEHRDAQAANGKVRVYAGLLVLLLTSGAVCGLAALLWRRFVGQRADALASRDRLQELGAAVPDIVFETGPDGRLTSVTEASWPLLGQAPQELIGRAIDELVLDPAQLPPPLSGSAEGTDPASSECEWRHADGSARRMRITAFGIPGEGGRAARGAIRDLSERLSLEWALRERDQRLREVVDATPSALLVVSSDGHPPLYNRAFADLVSAPAETDNEAVLNRLPRHAVDLVSALLASPRLGSSEVSHFVEEFPDSAGTVRIAELLISSYRVDEGISGVVVEAHDITDQQRRADELERLAEFDHLTGLPNRFSLERQISEAIDRNVDSGKLLTLMLVDLDRFKLVNDTMGHAAGDALLEEVAERLRAAVPSNHTLARLGGDEFLVLTPPIESVSDAAQSARAVVRRLSDPFSIDGRMFHVGASVGISLFPDDGKDAATLIRRADSAMYRAKDIGGDGYQFANPAVDTAMEGRLSLESDLRQALERDQFVVYYQPLVEIASGELAALEVLLRWERPDEGLIPPSSFVPLLEELGLIDEVGEWVLRTACEQNRKWQEKDLGPIPIAVNISAHQLRRGDLTDRVSRVLSETGLEPRFLQLEVTETAALKNMEHAVRTLHELRDLGVSTAVDDFGTGHSSLTRLQEFPVSALKIDKSFVKNVYRDGDGRAIVSGVIALGHALNMTVVAEGVETRAQLDALKALGCDVAQGFLLSRPLPAEACELMLREGRALVELQAA